MESRELMTLAFLTPWYFVFLEPSEQCNRDYLYSDVGKLKLSWMFGSFLWSQTVIALLAMCRSRFQSLGLIENFSLVAPHTLTLTDKNHDPKIFINLSIYLFIWLVCYAILNKNSLIIWWWQTLCWEKTEQYPRKTHDHSQVVTRHSHSCPSQSIVPVRNPICNLLEVDASIRSKPYKWLKFKNGVKHHSNDPSVPPCVNCNKFHSK